MENYSREYWISSNDCFMNTAARTNEGLKWNYFIAEYIDYDLHCKLLSFKPSQLLPFIDILSLIRSGYFDTAAKLSLSLEVEQELEPTRNWLISTLEQADDL